MSLRLTADRSCFLKDMSHFWRVVISSQFTVVTRTWPGYLVPFFLVSSPKILGYLFLIFTYLQDTNSIPACLKSTTWTWPGRDLSPECTSSIGNVWLFKKIGERNNLYLLQATRRKLLHTPHNLHWSKECDRHQTWHSRSLDHEVCAWQYKLKINSFITILFQWTLGLPSHPRSHFREDCH